MADYVIDCVCCGEAVALSSGIDLCWWNAAEALRSRNFRGMYVEGWAVRRQLDGRLHSFWHAWVELGDGRVEDPTPHNHVECREWYFAGLRRQRGPDAASGSAEAFSHPQHSHAGASAEELASVDQAAEKARELCRRANGDVS